MYEASLGAELQAAQILRTAIAPLTFQGLVDEAGFCRAGAQRVESETCLLEADGAVNGRGRCWIAGPGEQLRDFHTRLGSQIAQNFAMDAGRVFPTRASYLYYDEGDYSFLHHDAIHAHITVIVGLSEHLTPLVMFPAFTAITSEDVERLNLMTSIDLPGQMRSAFGARAYPHALKISYHEAVALRGRRVPHARLPQLSPGAVCTACYAFLKPPLEWMLA